MPFQETGAQELLDRVHRSDRPAVAVRARRRRGPRAPHRDHARHALLLAHRDRHARHPLGARRPARRARAGALADPALDRRAGHDRVRGRLPGQAPRLRDRRGGVRRARARAHRRGALPRGDRHAAVHHRRRRRPLGRGRRGAVRRLRRADRADHARAGRAREDLGEHPALHELRAAQPADDGLRALRGERLRGDRPDQPRLPARRHRPAGPDRRDLPAQGLRLLRGALRTRPGCCSRSRA